MNIYIFIHASVYIYMLHLYTFLNYKLHFKFKHKYLQ